MDTLHEDKYTFFFIISRAFLLRMKSILGKSCRENQDNSITFFSKIVLFVR